MNKKNYRARNVTIYLGNEPERQRRLARLDEIATRHGVTRSQLLQRLADGEMEIMPAAGKRAS